MLRDVGHHGAIVEQDVVCGDAAAHLGRAAEAISVVCHRQHECALWAARLVPLGGVLASGEGLAPEGPGELLGSLARCCFGHRD